MNTLKDCTGWDDMAQGGMIANMRNPFGIVPNTLKGYPISA